MTTPTVSEREKFDFEVATRNRELALKERECAVSEKELALKEMEASVASWKNPLTIAIAGAILAAFGNILAMYLGGSQQRELEDRKLVGQTALEKSKAEGSRVLAAINTGGDPDKAAGNLKFLIDTQLIEDQTLRDKVVRYLKERPTGSGAATSSAASDGGKSIAGAGVLTCRLEATPDFKTLEKSISAALETSPFDAISNWYTSGDGDHGLSSALHRQDGAQEKIQFSFHLYAENNAAVLKAIVTARSETYMSLMPTGDTSGRIVSRDVWYQYMGPLQKTLEGLIRQQGKTATCSPGTAG